MSGLTTNYALAYQTVDIADLAKMLGNHLSREQIMSLIQHTIEFIDDEVMDEMLEEFVNERAN